jgi:RNA polymerase sigma factor (sigma-70 family)
MPADAPRTGPSDRSDEDVVASLVARARRGDRDAAEALFARHLRALYAYILRRVDSNAADAEDVLQETVTAAVVALPTYRRAAGFWAWLTAIARNKATDHLRAAIARGRHIRSFGGSDAELERIARSLATDDLAAHVEDAETVRAAVAAALSALEPEDQELLLFKYRDGESVATIAGRRGATEKSIESRLYRARERFREAFEAGAGERRTGRRAGKVAP